MSMMKCSHCGVLVDTDSFPESLYIIDDDCLCQSCADKWAKGEGQPLHDMPEGDYNEGY